jgi:hypothetical protein
MTRVSRPIAILILSLGGLCLLASLLAGVIRLGVVPPLGFAPLLAAAHAPLMGVGFLGAMIGFERSVFSRRKWLVVAPISASLGALISIGWPPSVGIGALVSGAALLAPALRDLFGARALVATAHAAAGGMLMSIGRIWGSGDGAGSWFGSLLAFLMLSIFADRLSFHSRRARRRDSWWICAPIVLAGLAGGWSSDWNPGQRPTWLALGGGLLASWLLFLDREGLTLRSAGSKRYHAGLRLCGAIWLAVASLLFALLPVRSAGPLIDAPVHALTTGFVLSFLFAHAPIVFAGLLGRTPAWHPWLVWPALLLQVSVLLRVLGALFTSPFPRQLGGMLTLTAIVAFLIVSHLRIGSGREIWKEIGRR